MAAPESPESGPEAEASSTSLSPESDRGLDRGLRLFLDESRRYLTSEYPAKLTHAVGLLDRADLWWRPSPATNSAGHLLRHLSGNARQWVVHGIGRRPDVRDRASEFSEEGAELPLLLDDLAATMEAADGVLGDLTPDMLMERRSIQGIETTVLQALYHVVEHFSMHTGQVLWIVKARTGRDLGFYQVDDRGHVIGTRW